MAEKKQVQLGKLALRLEGKWWNAYYAKTDKMGDALLLGSVRAEVARTPDFRKRFMELMQDVVSQIIEEVTGETPTWGGPKGKDGKQIDV